MRTFDAIYLLPAVAEAMRRQSLLGLFDGTASTFRYMDRCKGYHEGTGTLLIFTRDTGHHSSGWWKNPDYERCWHLSISFFDPVTQDRVGKDKSLTRRWCEAFFGSDTEYIWAEPPYSDDGKSGEVWHYRVFCDPAWQPIIPRGEVYSKEFTERGWLSWSDLQAEIVRKESTNA